MFMGSVLSFVKDFVETINETLEELEPGSGLSTKQRYWISFCLMAIMITNSVCWAKFERASLGRYSVAALSWMLRHSKIPWNLMLQASVTAILRKYGITEGSLLQMIPRKNERK